MSGNAIGPHPAAAARFLQSFNANLDLGKVAYRNGRTDKRGLAGKVELGRSIVTK